MLGALNKIADINIVEADGGVMSLVLLNSFSYHINFFQPCSQIQNNCS